MLLYNIDYIWLHDHVICMHDLPCQNFIATNMPAMYVIVITQDEYDILVIT